MTPKMKWLKILIPMLALHCIVWLASHWYFSNNNREILLVVDTSYSMKAKSEKVLNWIEDYETADRYKSITIGTDKAVLGDLSKLSSKDVIFRTSFGKLTPENLTRLYSNSKVDERILLSDGSLHPKGWELITF